MTRGFLKYYILKLLSEEPLTGYGLMKRIEEETGFWKPSTGSMYPLLQALEDQELITHEGGGSTAGSKEDRKVYSLTKQGRTALAAACQAKAEILESLQRSFDVCGRIFGAQEAEELSKQMQSWFKEGAPPGFEKIPKSLKPRLFLLRQILFSLPYEKLSEKQIRKINEILDGALTQLGEFAE